MESFSALLVPIAVAVVAVVLLLGLWNMMRGGSGSRTFPAASIGRSAA